MKQKRLLIKFAVIRSGFLLLFMSLGSFLLAQQVSGVVTDEANGEALIGATVLVQGSTSGTVTDIDGVFTIDANDGDILEISYTGYSTRQLTVGVDDLSSVSLSSGVALDEIVVTGYSVESKRQTTGAVSTIKPKDLQAIPSGNVEQQLQGRVAGVTVLTNGQPGSTSQIRVRGFGAFGGNAPLYVVDGVPVGSTDFLNPDDIETSTVLKDAAAASIYGARAANGVIVYTTKKGSRSSRGLTVTYDGVFGLTDPNVGGAPKMLTPQEDADWTHIAYRNNAAVNGTDPAYTHPQYGNQAQAVLPVYLHADGRNGLQSELSQAELDQIRANYEADPDNVFLFRPNVAGTDWYDEITRTAPLMRHTLGFSGGSDNSRFYFGLAMQDQSGILIENEFERYSFRANSEFDVLPWLRIGENLQFTYRSTRGGFGGNGGISGADDESVILSAYRMPRIIPVRDEFGSYASTRAAGFNNPRNPVRTLQTNDVNDRFFNTSAFGNLYLELEPIEKLVFRSSIGGQYVNFFNKNYGYKYLGDSEPQASDTFSEGGGYSLSWVFSNTLSYNYQVNRHSFNLLLGIEALNTGAGRNFGGSGINPFSTDLDFVNLSTVQSPQVNSGLNNGVNFYSLFGKFDYNFSEKYYFTALVRRDGSSRFGENNRYGVFPAFSGAWRVTAEPFMQGVSWIYDLKIRAGWGQMGNSNNVNPNNQYSLYASDRGQSFYPIGGQSSGADEGFTKSRIGNPDAKWETSEMTNIGFDISFFNNRLEIYFDWWKKETIDLLYQVPIAGVVGNSAAAPSVNVATMLNQGLDIQLITRGNFSRDFRYELILNNSFLKNEITYLAPGIDFFSGNGYRGINPIRNAVGQPLSSFFGYKMIGYFNSEEEVQSSPEQADAAVGRFKYEDVNDDGVITPDDRTFIGNPVPDYTGGYTLSLFYKNLSLSTYWYAAVGVDIFNQSKWFTDFFGSFQGSGKGVRAKESWTPELGNNAKAPIWESASNISTNGAENSWYVESGNFLRLQQVALNYDFTSGLIERWGLSRLRVGISANNLFTITKYQGLDPMVGGGADTNFGIDVGNYPVTRGYTLNLGISF